MSTNVRKLFVGKGEMTTLCNAMDRDIFTLQRRWPSKGVDTLICACSRKLQEKSTNGSILFWKQKNWLYAKVLEIG